jgi:Xaa-Pro aminopeptidase
VSRGAPTGSRLEGARAALEGLEADALLISRPAMMRWLAGFILEPGEEHNSGYSGTLLVSRDAAVVLADGRYREQAEAACVGWDVRLTTDPIHNELPRVASSLGVRLLAAEAEVLPHAAWAAIEAAGLPLVAADDRLRGLRAVKDADEVAAIGRACALTDACFAHLLAAISPGMTERAAAWELERWFRENGAEALAFTPLVLAGARASMPHGHPGETVVERGQALLIDFGCQVDGYRSDMTRTIFFGEPDAETRRRYDAVLGAQEAARSAAAPGVIGADLDRIARAHLADAGLGEAFTHGLGHGIGLETHEPPMLKLWQQPLQAGMVFTLEPGVYFPGDGGIRIEDDVLLTDAGAVRLTEAPRDLLVV